MIKDNSLHSTSTSSSSRFGPANYDHNIGIGGSALSNTNGLSHNGDSSLPIHNGHGSLSDERKFGTLDGVFLPCIQTILGVILFLRLPSITAQAGCMQTTLIILMCTTSTFPTALSLSAIATNGQIEAGGPYYVISRTLGAEIGGAIGLLFYIGTSISCSMYVLGAVEALQDTSFQMQEHMFPFDTQIACLIIMFVMATIVVVGIHYVNMSSKFFLVCVVFSILSYYVGTILFSLGIFYGELGPMDRLFVDNIWPQYEPDPITEIKPTFFSLLALFYPSVTGILAGSNRSAVLSNPSRSIPVGTIGAIGFTTMIYITTVWLLGCTVANYTLKHNKMLISAIAFPSGELLKLGIVMSSLGAAIQCMAGAPRLLAAIAFDDSIPFLRYVKPRSMDANPTKAIWVTCALAAIPTLSGNLDHITPIITMFFLLTYASINLCCFFLDILKPPGFRPTFKYFHWTISLFGFVWCLGLALIISWYTAILTFLLFFILYLYNKKQLVVVGEKDWGDVGDALRFTSVTELLRALSSDSSRMEEFHAKNWRPQLLTLIDMDVVGNPTNLYVLRLAAQMNKGHGLNMVFSVLQNRGSFATYETCDLVWQARKTLKHHMKKEQMDGFEEVFATSNKTKSEAIWSAVIHSGLGPVSPNTVMLSWLKHWEMDQNAADEYVDTLSGIMNMKKAVILFKGSETYPSSTGYLSGMNQQASLRSGRNSLSSAFTIDIWWVVHDGGLLLLLPYLLSRNHVWRDANLRVFAVTCSSTENPERLEDAVRDHLQQVRIDASVTAVVDLCHTDIAEDMRNIDSVPTGFDKKAQYAFTNTQNMTVGEVFSKEVYDVPYQQIDDLEKVIGAELGYNEFPNPPPSASLDEEQQQDQSSSTTNQQKVWKEKRSKTAKVFNQALHKYSQAADLIVTNMPLIRSTPGSISNKNSSDFLGYVDSMTKGFDNVLLIRGSGAEVITTYA